ncbi:MAG TPA: class I SAM-dependent methyltransferase [Mycobacteriales bacterium]|nr:class I SAM-dependent methyltransferase [Mycobacteriales bacterium]
MADWDEAAARNRAAWNEIAEVRSANIDRKGFDAEFFAAGGDNLPVPVGEALPDVEGRSLLHLQCASGEESLSWAVRGARVTAVDISDGLITIAEEKARRAGLDVRFVRADVGALPADLRSGTFDLAYTGGGVLVWIPDIDRWAEIVASTLRPGGTFVLYDGHPVTGCLENSAAGIVVAGDYFGRSNAEISSGWRHFPGGEDARSSKAEFSWPLGDIVTALIRAGLAIESLREFPSPEIWRFGDRAGEATRLPGAFLLVARRAAL